MRGSVAATLSSASASLWLWNGGVLGGNEDGGGRLDTKLSRIIALVYGNAHATPRVYIKEGFAHGNIHERLGIRHRNRLLVDLDWHLVALHVAKLFEFLSRNVGDQGAEGIVQADDVAF